MFLRALAAIAALLLVSCGSGRLPMPDMTPYRMEIQQGNFVSQEMVAKLKPGMSKDQVRFVMGTPLITDSFHGERWDYVFRRQMANSRELEQRKLAVFFEDGKLKRVEGDVTPAAGADAGGLKMPEERPASAAAPLSRPAAQTSSEAPKPAPAADKPAAAPVPSGDSKPQEKGWWERLKDKVGF
ncbi:MAG: outer membrane protein assembly factor BamE [Pseudomonadota bacterium]